MSTPEVTIHREGRRLVLEPAEMERDRRGWPKAWWDVAGVEPAFDVGQRTSRHEREDALRLRR